MKSLAKLLLCGLSISSSCQAPRYISNSSEINLKVCLRQENPETEDKYRIKFSSTEDLEIALEGLRTGEIKEGRWKGLRLSPCKKSAYALEDFVEPENSLVQTWIKIMQRKNPGLESMSPKEKLRVIYETFNNSYPYEMTPFDRLDHAESEEMPEDLREIFGKYYLGTQTVRSTHENSRGDCEDLSIFFVSYARALGLNSSLFFMTYKDRNVAHVIVKDSTDEEIFIDPSLWQFSSFDKNASRAKESTMATNIASVILIPRRHNPNYSVDFPKSTESASYSLEKSQDFLLQLQKDSPNSIK